MTAARRHSFTGGARVVDEGDLYQPPPDHGSIEEGTVGWDDHDDHFDIGTEDNDGHTLVRVTIRRGRAIAAADLKPEVAQGMKILARTGLPDRSVPAKNSAVIVARAAGTDAWHVIANPGPTTTLRNGPKPGDKVVEGYGGNFVRLAKDGSISFATTTDGTKDGRTVNLQVKRDGFVLVGPWGKFTQDATGLHVLDHSGARIDLGGIGGLPAPFDALKSYANLTAAIVKIAASAIVLGPDMGVADNVPLFTPLLAILVSISGALTALQSSVLAVEAVAATCLSTPATAAAITAAGIALTASGTATGAVSAGVATAPAELPSQAVTVV